MVNRNTGMLKRGDMTQVGQQQNDNVGNNGVTSRINNMKGMMKRASGQDVDNPVENVETAKELKVDQKDVPEVSEKKLESADVDAKNVVDDLKAKKQEKRSAQTPVQNKSVAEIKKPVKINTKITLDEITNGYIQMFKKHFDIDLNASIVFENMRKACDIPIKDPLKSLYLLENTYRVSTLIYLASNLPILFAATVLAELNRKNILKYVTSEVENGQKKTDELIEFRKKRWMDKYKNMQINDTMTVTLGVTNISDELRQKIQQEFDGICLNLKRFNKEMTDLISKFDDDTVNDIIYIYSNWWYFLQGFENVPEIRDYTMLITDDTRKNLRL